MYLNPEAALMNLHKSHAMYRQLGEPYYESQVLGTLSYTYLVIGDQKNHIKALQEQLEIAQNTGDRLLAVDARGVLGQNEELAGRILVAEVVYREVLPVFKEFGDHYHVSEYLARLADLAFLTGEFNRAREWATEGYTLSRQYNHASREMLALGVLSMVHNAELAFDRAAERGREIPANVQRFFLFLRARGLAFAMGGLEDFKTARKQLHYQIKGTMFFEAEGLQAQCLPVAALITAGQGDLERAAELLALAFHHPAAATGWLEKFPLITRLQERLETELEPEVLAAAWERGQALDLGETITALLAEDNSETPPPD
jgi:hypothetical protein